MTGYLHAGQFAEAELQTQLERFSGQWLYLESETQVELIHSQVTPAVLEFPYGRMFGQAGELRWLKHRNQVDIQWLSASNEQLQGFAAPLSFETQSTQIYLWGTHISYLTNNLHYLRDVKNTDPIWIETRIPRPLHYPVAGIKARVIIHAEHYLQAGLIRTTKWSRVEEHSDE